MQVRFQGPLLRSVFVLALFCTGFEWQGQIVRLEQELHSPDATRRRDAARQLSSYSAHEIRDALLFAFTDLDSIVRTEAAAAAGRVRLLESSVKLIDWLDDPDVGIRSASARALGQLGEPSAVPHLVRALGDATPEVRRAAVEALASIGSSDVIVPLLSRLDDSDTNVRVQAIGSLGNLGDSRAMAALAAKARDPVPEVRAAVCKALGNLRSAAATPVLVQALHDASEEVVLEAIAALGRLRVVSAMDPLAQIVSEQPTPRATSAAMVALSTMETPEALHPVVEALSGADTREFAAQTLIAHFSRAQSLAPQGIECRHALSRYLLSALRETTSSMHADYIGRVLAETVDSHDADLSSELLSMMETHPGTAPHLLRALGATSSQSALIPLLEGLSSQDNAVRSAVLGGLQNYFTNAPSEGLAADPLMIALERTEDTQEQCALVRALGLTKAERAVRVVIPYLKHADPELRMDAVTALGSIGGREAARALVQVLTDRDARARLGAAEKLGDIATAETCRELIRLFSERGPIDRHSILIAIGKSLGTLRKQGALDSNIAEAARMIFKQVLASNDVELAARAIDATAASHSPAYVALLKEVLAHGEPSLRGPATLALASFEDVRVAPILRELMTSANPDVRASAMAAFAQHAGKSDAATLLALTKNSSWPLSAIAAFGLARLGKSGLLDASLAPELCGLVSVRDPYVRANVAIALATLNTQACGPITPVSLLDRRHTPVVRAAAARWLQEIAGAPSNRGASPLQRCADRDSDSHVQAVCENEILPHRTTGEVDMYAYESDGKTPRVRRWVALRFWDGSVLIVLTDQNSHIRYPFPASSIMMIEDPLAQPLEAEI